MRFQLNEIRNRPIYLFTEKPEFYFQKAT